MFVFDFLADVVLEQIWDWLYARVISVLCELFSMMSYMGVELLDYPWVKAIIQLFHKLGWALFVVGLVVALFECGIEYQSGRGNFKEFWMNVLKGFFAASLFTVLPVELFKLSVRWQALFISALGGISDSSGIGSMAADVLQTVIDNSSGPLNLTGIFIFIAYGYAVIKVFFSNLKRGGILVTQIAVGSLYMFSLPRGCISPFAGWMKTVIGLCLTTFLQSIFLTAGLMVFRDNMILGLGLMLSAGEIPRICGQFGLETGTRANIMGGVYAAQTMINITRTIAKAVV